ncbi:hypothetical protein PBCVCVR1_025L [Paramecium bursaria Chlorella virus CVR-1]|uniref:Uncharacterized protein n=1 Tax=Paramecium bursaria Chlorella virus CVA-1 TaxID=42683 RepID=M1HJK4_9PHYC|nr:hypothetical protein F8205_gp009 [Paramecium bursaria Chlorella virus CVA-1]AGE50364.1 hypothetical protein PBCVCVA1_021L [Paramecium bursaria Chlorella virus CVA-1]AGE51040.1 hypothetical protein PBCVCVG1_024L [Paramecium bursaria Chlorella virus CVG-1]AGE52039.1 hypothetical protein PBCVCVR1_025L [Paramecium bursaria Chlorella virus CVR-1]
MNSYLLTFFWAVTLYLVGLSIVHFIRVLKARNPEDKMDLVKAIVYVSSAVTLGVLLVYRPFDTSVVTKILKYRPQVHADTSTAATLITTTLSGVSV